MATQIYNYLADYQCFYVLLICFFEGFIEKIALKKILLKERLRSRCSLCPIITFTKIDNGLKRIIIASKKGFKTE